MESTYDLRVIFQYFGQSFSTRYGSCIIELLNTVQFIPSGMKHQARRSRCSMVIFVEQMKQPVPQHTDVGCNTVSINQFTRPVFVPIPLRGSFAFQVRGHG